MAELVSLSEAKAQLAGLVNAAEAGEVVQANHSPWRYYSPRLADEALQSQQQGSRIWEAIVQWRPAGQPPIRPSDPWRLA